MAVSELVGQAVIAFIVIAILVSAYRRYSHPPRDDDRGKIKD